MIYTLDTEFIEGFHKPLFGKRRHFIDLISIGIVSEDGRKYSAISNEYRYEDADNWVKENVIAPLYNNTVHGVGRECVFPYNFHKTFGKTNKAIATEILEFVDPGLRGIKSDYCSAGIPGLDTMFTRHNVAEIDGRMVAQPELWAYYADYDWVVFCSLFGRMIDLPKGFPMYCRDLKQEMDLCEFPKENRPPQANEHDALADAQWNMELLKAINKFKAAK